MAINFNAESIGASGYAVRGPVSAAPGVGYALGSVGVDQLGWVPTSQDFQDTDLSGLPDANPGSGLPWLDPNTGCVVIGNALLDSRYLQLTGGASVSVNAVQANAGNTLTLGTTDAQDTYFKTNNINRWFVDGSGHLRTFSDNAYDIGQSASGRPRDVNIGRNLNVAGTGNFAGRLIVPSAGSSGSPSIKLGSFESGFFEGTGRVFGVYNASTVFAMDSLNFNLRSTTALGWASGSPDATNADASIVRKSAGLLASRSNSGFAVRNLADSADASFSASSGQFTGGVYVNDGNASPSFSFYFAPDTGMSLESNTVGSRKLRFRTDGADAMTLGGSGTQRIASFAGDVSIVNNKALLIKDNTGNDRVAVRIDNNNALELRNNAAGEWIAGTVNSFSARLRTANSDRLIIDSAGVASFTGRVLAASSLVVGSTVSPTYSAFNGSVDGAIGLLVRPNATTSKGLVVRGLNSQSSNPFEVQNSAASVLVGVGADGTCSFANRILVGDDTTGSVRLEPGSGGNKGYIAWHKASGGTRVGYMGYGTGDDVELVLTNGGNFKILSGNIITPSLIQPNETTPASASATGVKGTIVWDANYVYVCTATNTWKRTALASW